MKNVFSRGKYRYQIESRTQWDGDAERLIFRVRRRLWWLPVWRIVNAASNGWSFPLCRCRFDNYKDAYNVMKLDYWNIEHGNPKWRPHNEE